MSRKIDRLQDALFQSTSPSFSAPSSGVPVFRSNPSLAFTLLELLVSMTLVLILMVLLEQITGNTSKIWRTSMTKIQSFQEARAGFDSMTRRLGQATLNTYWDYLDASGLARTGSTASTFVPATYARQSELHFICGDAATLLAKAAPLVPNVVTHAIFFQAPLGYAVGPSYTNLVNGLNACGYFVQFGSDQATIPAFLNTPKIPLQYRYRLMEMTQRTENLSVYNPAAATPNSWFLTTAGSNSRVIAKNVIALALLPKVSPSEQQNPGGVADDLTKDYSYDSRITDPKSVNRNQLPPLVQVTAVVLDEDSANRLDNGPTPPDFGIDIGTLFKTVANYSQDLDKLQKALAAKHLVYRVFTTDVSILGAKWSSN